VSARLIILLICVSGLAGCAPFVPFVDYRPNMQDGKVTRDNCLGYERVAYQVGGVNITSRINQHSRNGANSLAFSVYLTIPEGEYATFLSTVVKVEKWRNGAMIGKPIDAETGIIAVHQSIEFGAPRGSLDPLLTMVGSTAESRGRKFNHAFSIGVGLEQMFEDDYRITLPKMNINGNIATIPSILFTRTMRAKFMVPINC
jgi:hypothetical protein